MHIRPLVRFLTLVLCTGAALQYARASIHQYAVEVSATVHESPPSIDFVWPVDSTAENYYVFKKGLADTTWGEVLSILPGTASSYSDSDVSIGEIYEYSFQKNLGTYRDTLLVQDGSAVTFRIRDSWGDGICCHHGFGFYSVAGCDTTYALGGEFGDQEIASFTTADTQGECNRLIVSVTLDLYGQETTWTLTDDGTGDLLGSGGPYEPPRFGHLVTGIRVPPTHERGTILILSEEVAANELAAEINRLRLDMIGDGYRVRIRTVPSDESVPNVKNLILSEYGIDPTINTLLLFGHIPVPYSGDVWSGHANHRGAWPADVYYGELDGPWTDEFVDNETAARPENHNVPGDGKFDQTWLPSDLDLQIGRVDLSNMPAFEASETELLRRYSNKNHSFRRGQVSAEARGLIDDNVGEAYGLAPAATGWRNFATMFGADQIDEGDFFPDLLTESYLWAYGCGGSFYTYCGGVGGTEDFAADTVLAVFTSLYGSYFGDWDNRNNVLRAPLAAEGYPLTCFWSGRPIWNLQHLSLGLPIGYSARLTQNNKNLYRAADGSRGIHIALMGDPTLRLHVVPPITNLRIESSESEEVRLSWSPPNSEIDGHHVYRAASISEGFVLLTDLPTPDTTYVDANPLPGKNVYMVRSLELQTTGSGSYFNLACGLIDSLENTADVVDTSDRRIGFRLRTSPTSRGTDLGLSLARGGIAILTVYNLSGSVVRRLLDGTLPAGESSVWWDCRDDRGNLVPSGIYLVRLTVDGTVLTGKVTVLR